jgi:hypothetical protein
MVMASGESGWTRCDNAVDARLWIEQNCNTANTAPYINDGSSAANEISAADTNACA